MEFGNYKDKVQLLNQKKSVNCYDCFFASPFIKYVLPSFLVVIFLVTFSYFGLFHLLPLEDPNSQATCHLQPSYYVPCAPGRPKIDKDECLEVGCCWREDAKMCYHSYPSRYGYKVHEYKATTDGLEGNITALKTSSPSGKPSVHRLGFQVRQIDENTLQISLKPNAEDQTRSRRRQQVETVTAASQQPIVKQKKLADYGRLFDFLPRNDEARITEFTLNSTKVLLQEPHFSLTIPDAEDNSIVLSTARGPLIMTDDYWELTLYLADGGSLQGLGKLELNATTNWIYNNENRTLEPVLLALRSNVTCRLDYKGPLEIQILKGSNLVILRGISIPKDGLTFTLHKSPSPFQTIQKLSNTKSHPQLLSLNRLGLHLCPDKHENLKSAIELLKKLTSSDITTPWDSHCLSRRHLGPTLEHDVDLALVTEALEILDGRTLAAHLTPMLFNNAESLLQSSLESKSCLLRNSTDIHVGMYDSQSVVYPEWNEEKTSEIARNFLDRYVRELQLDFVVLRDAWPRDEIPHNVPDESFEYLPEGLHRLMSNGTIPFDLQNRQHYTVHNSYASNFANFVGSKGVELRGHECNSPNVEVSWSNLQSIFEVGVVSAMMGEVPNAMYVCGANPTRINDELCVRWYALAVVWPRILSVPEKSPFPGTRLSRTSAKSTSKLLQLRATLTTYQRTTLASFAREGSPILAATGLYFSDGPISATQFFWGDSILVGLVLLPRHNQVSMWLPGEHVWRHLQGGSPVGPSTNGIISVTVLMGEVALLVRPGRIIPVHQEIGKNSIETSLKNLELLANPMCDSANICEASGRVYFGDDDASGEFLLINYYSNGTLTLSNVLEVKKMVCEVTPTRQTSIFQNFQVLGETTSYKINLNLCDLSGDYNVELKKSDGLLLL